MDILDETYRLLIECDVDAASAASAIKRARILFGGERVYICKAGEEREEEIRRALEDGRPLKEVAKRVGASVSTIRRRRSEWFL